MSSRYALICVTAHTVYRDTQDEKQKSETSVLVRWSFTLQKNNPDIRHIKGKDNVVADALFKVAY